MPTPLTPATATLAGSVIFASGEAAGLYLLVENQSAYDVTVKPGGTPASAADGIPLPAGFRGLLFTRAGITWYGRSFGAGDATPLARTADYPPINVSAASSGGVPTSRLLTAGVGLSGGGDLSADRTFDLEDTAVTAGSYTYASITVDAQGRITSASSGAAPAPTTRTLTAGTGLSGGGDLSADRTFDLEDTAVTPGSYVAATVVVDQQGRITSATAGSYVAPSRTITAGTGLSGGGDLSADRTVNLADTAVSPGAYTYASVTVDQQGRLTSAASGAAPALASRTLTAGTGLSGGGDLSADRTFNLANTAVTAGSYVAATITVDAQGRLTAASAGSYVPTTRTITAGTGLSGGGDLSANRSLALADTAVSAGSYTYSSITVDAQGRLTAASSGAAPAVATRTISAGTGLTGGGDLSADRTLTLANTAVTAGSYTYASVTVDAQGRLTSASSGTTPVAATRTITAGTGLSGGGDLSADRTLSLANTAVTAGTYTLATITVDAQGRLTSASSGAEADTLQTVYARGASTDGSNGAVALANAAANNNSVLTVSKAPSGAQSGNVFTVTAGANASGNAVDVTQSGSGTALNVSLGSNTGAKGVVVTSSVANTNALVTFTANTNAANGDILQINRSPGGGTNTGNGLNINWIGGAGNGSGNAILITVGAGGAVASGSIFKITNNGGGGTSIDVTCQSTAAAILVTKSSLNAAAGISVIQQGSSDGILAQCTAAAGRCLGVTQNTTSASGALITTTCSPTSGTTTSKTLSITVGGGAGTVSGNIIDVTATKHSGVCLNIAKTPGAALGGNLVTVTAGANCSGDGVSIAYSGTGVGLNVTAGSAKFAGNMGWFGTTPVAQQTRGATATNNVVASGTTDQFDDWTSLTLYATDAAAIHATVSQLCRIVRQYDVALRAYGIVT